MPNKVIVQIITVASMLIFLLLLVLLLLERDGNQNHPDDDSGNEDTITNGTASHDGFMDETLWKDRQLDWLAFATTQSEMDPTRLDCVMTHLAREQRTDSYTVEANTIPDDAWDHVFDKLYRLRDTSDFEVLLLIDLLNAHGGHPAASPQLWERADQALLTFKYWHSDPTPARTVDGEQVLDNMWYWTENHVLVFKVCGYLAGMRLADQTFAVSGLTGREHMLRAEPYLKDWFDQRAMLGFLEWHSNVY